MFNESVKYKPVAYQLSEAELIARVENGDIAVFEVLIRRYNPYLYKVGRSYGFNHHDVEDLMQETFIKAFENLTKLANKEFFKTWLIRIMLNECYKKRHRSTLRKENNQHSLLNDKIIPMFSGDNDTERNILNKEMHTVIENAVQRIPADYRIVFSLRELNGLSVMETATVLNLTETNVKVRLSRAKAMLRKEVEKMYSADDIFQFNLIYCDKITEKVMHAISAKFQT